MKICKTKMSVNGVEYPLATTLRVAYVLQGMHNHKSYMEIFQDLGTMPIEEQIGVIYAAYVVACDHEPMSKEEFKNLCLDNLTLTEIMGLIKSIIEGITGKKVEEANPTQDSENSQKKN